MSRTTQPPRRRPLAAALLALAGLAGPLATVHGQSISAERALLNAIPVAYWVVLVANESPSPARGRGPFFTLGARGALSLAVASDEARYGVTPVAVEDARMLTISLGATRAAGALTPSMPGDR